MNYLKDYNITDEQIKDIENELKKRNIDINLFIYDPEKIIAVLDIFKDIGVNNFFDIIMTSPSMFCDTIRSIKLRLDSYENKNELAQLLNEDASNLFIVDLM